MIMIMGEQNIRKSESDETCPSHLDKVHARKRKASTVGVACVVLKEMQNEMSARPAPKDGD
jgi:hypothetical protein